MGEGRKLISVVTGCYNELENIPLFYDRTRKVLAQFPEYDYEFVVADNCSTDGTRDVLRKIAASDKKFKVILNANNFGHIRSPYNALLNSSGDVVFFLCSDLQESPEMLVEFMKKYQEGYQVVCGVRSESHAGFFVEKLRMGYYWLLRKFSPGRNVIQRFTGFGLYDRKFIEALRKFHEAYPYFRGLVGEIGFRHAEVPFVQDRRMHGVTKNNLFTLYDLAMTGFVNHTLLPLRLAVLAGLFLGGCSFVIAGVYFVMKLVWWDTFSLGLAPLVIGLFFLSAVQLVFIGVVGEYIGAIWMQVKNRPLVIEDERINFD